MAESIRHDSATQIRSIHIGDSDFNVDLYFDPHRLPRYQQRSLSRRLGSRMKGGISCLNIDEAAAYNGILNRDYSVIGFAKNTAADDEVSGSMQLYNWCSTSENPQLWINDLCRITDGIKPKQSPLEPLLRVFEDIAISARITELYLLVENKEPERTVLPAIYAKYGFRAVDSCKLVDDDSIVMRKDIIIHRGGKASKQKVA